MSLFQRTLTPVDPVVRWQIKKGGIYRKTSAGEEFVAQFLTGKLKYLSVRSDAGNITHNIDPHEVILVGLMRSDDDQGDKTIECHSNTTFGCAQLLEGLVPVQVGDKLAIECALGENGVTRVRVHVQSVDEEWIPTPVRESSSAGADRAELVARYLADLPKHTAFKPFHSV